MAGLRDALQAKGTGHPFDGMDLAMNLRPQIAIAGIDSLGLCLFTAAAASKELLAELVNTKLGTKMTPEDLQEGWKRLLDIERAFNRKAGFTKSDDRLPEFFTKEKLAPHDKVFEVSDAELDKVYNF